MRSNIAHHLTEHNCCMVTQKDQIDIGMEYADDISNPTSDHSSIERFKHCKREALESRGLMINKDKTEQSLINRTTYKWKK